MKARITRSVALVTGALFAVHLAGCAMNYAPHTSDAQLVLYEVHPNQGWPEAAFEGRIQVDEDHGYVYGVQSDGTELGLKFPEGTSTTKEGVELPAGLVIPWEQEVILGGGYSETSPASVPEYDYETYFSVNDESE